MSSCRSLNASCGSRLRCRSPSPCRPNGWFSALAPSCVSSWGLLFVSSRQALRRADARPGGGCLLGVCRHRGVPCPPGAPAAGPSRRRHGDRGGRRSRVAPAPPQPVAAEPAALRRSAAGAAAASGSLALAGSREVRAAPRVVDSSQPTWEGHRKARGPVSSKEVIDATTRSTHDRVGGRPVRLHDSGRSSTRSRPQHCDR